jgi:DNA-binding transcriptional LysR family regulator
MSGHNIPLDHQIGRRLRLRDLSVFSAVAQHQSMAKAALELGVAQPSVSEVIAGLEQTYGVKLFDRSPRGVELTVYGQALLKRCIAVFDEIKQSRKDIEFLADPTLGEIRLACAEGLSATILPEILLHFAQRYPHVVLHVDNLTAPATPNDMAGLRNRKYDLALVRGSTLLAGDPMTEDLKVRVLFNEGYVLAAGIHSPWAHRSKIELAELIDEPWILSPPGYWHHRVVEEAFRAQGLSPPKPSIVSLAVTLRMRLLAGGPYITAFGSSVMLHNAQRFGIALLPVTLPRRKWSAVFVTLKNRTQSPVVERFIESAYEIAKSFPTREAT